MCFSNKSFLILGTGGYHILIGNLASATLMCRWAFSCGADLLANDGAGKFPWSGLVWRLEATGQYWL